MRGAAGGRTVDAVTGRQKAYFGFRGASAGLFLLSATVLTGTAAVVCCFAAGFGGLLTCLGVNAGGPGERAGARVQQVQWDKTRAPQGDWPPYDDGKVIDGELLN
jgi:hypothetical protein